MTRNLNPDGKLAHVLAAIEAVTGKSATPSGTGYQTCCPAHEDENPSLSVASGKDGGVVLHCFAGCTPEAILKAAGLSFSDLMPPGNGASGLNRSPRPALAPRALDLDSEIGPTTPAPVPVPAGRAAKAIEAIRSAPVEQTIEGEDGSIYSNGQYGPPVAVYPYLDEAGVELYRVVRFREKQFRQYRPNSVDGFLASLQGVEPVLFNLQAAIATSRAEGRVYLCEGEKDACNLIAQGLVATTKSGGAAAPWKEAYTEDLRGAEVIVLPDNDPPGRKSAEQAAKALRDAGVRVRVLDLPSLPEKGDVSDWLDAGGTVEDLELEADKAPFWGEKPLPRVLSASDFLAAERPALEWLIEGILPRGGKLTFSATSKFGKSMWAIQIGLALAAGNCEWLGWKFGAPAKVLYLQCEIMDALLKARLGMIIEQMPPQIDRERASANFLIQEIGEQRPNLISDDGRRIVGRLIEVHKPDVLILDPLAALCPGLDENSSDSMTLQLDFFAELARETGAANILVHHHGKAGGSRGSSAFEAWPESDLQATFADDSKTVAKVEQRLRCTFNSGPRYWRMPTPESIWFEPMPDGWEPGAKTNGQSLGEQLQPLVDIVREASEPVKYTDLAKAYADSQGVSTRTARRRIETATKMGLISAFEGRYFLKNRDRRPCP